MRGLGRPPCSRPRPCRSTSRRGRRRLLEEGFLRLLAFLRRHGLAPLAGVLLLLISLHPTAAANIGPTKESKVEAVLLFNLARFVDWPPEAFATTNAPLVIGILGRDPFGPVLDEVLRGELANGHPLQARRCATVQEAADCQLVFVSSSERARAKSIVSTLKAHPVLTVSDLEAFCRSSGGMVAFYVNEEHHIRLRLNLDAAKAAGLSVSSKLIQVAELEHATSSMNCVPGAFALAASAAPIPFHGTRFCRGPALGRAASGL